MKKLLVTGGTVFVSKYVAEYFSNKNEYEVFVLNRNNHPQPANTKLINLDRKDLQDKLKKYNFDIVLDITSYNKNDVQGIYESVGDVPDYIFLSSSAVYPETEEQPFMENAKVGFNKFWKDYGMNKIEAEEYLRSVKPDSYIIRPPYLYGPENNVYREAFVFECAENNRPFYIPSNGDMKLQFFYIEDLCKIIEKIIKTHPEEKIFNVGNEESVSIKEWIKLCYEVVGKDVIFKNVNEEIEQRNYFSFYNYEYKLDITRQKNLLKETTNLKEGLRESYCWYKNNKDKVNRKAYLDFINKNFEQ